MDKTQSTVAQQLLTLHDELDAFSESLTFFCEGTTGIVASSGYFEDITVRGVERSARSVKQQAEGLKQLLNQAIEDTKE